MRPRRLEHRVEPLLGVAADAVVIEDRVAELLELVVDARQREKRHFAQLAVGTGFFVAVGGAWVGHAHDVAKHLHGRVELAAREVDQSLEVASLRVQRELAVDAIDALERRFKRGFCRLRVLVLVRFDLRALASSGSLCRCRRRRRRGRSLGRRRRWRLGLCFGLRLGFGFGFGLGLFGLGSAEVEAETVFVAAAEFVGGEVEAVVGGVGRTPLGRCLDGCRCFFFGRVV